MHRSLRAAVNEYFRDKATAERYKAAVSKQRDRESKFVHARAA